MTPALAFVLMFLVFGGVVAHHVVVLRRAGVKLGPGPGGNGGIAGIGGGVASCGDGGAGDGCS